MDEQEVERRLIEEATKLMGIKYIVPTVDHLALRAILVQLMRMNQRLESIDDRLMHIEGNTRG